MLENKITKKHIILEYILAFLVSFLLLLDQRYRMRFIYIIFVWYLYYFEISNTLLD